MEIAKISTSGIRVKTKLATIAITPFAAKGKVSVDCVLLFNRENQQLPSFETEPLIVEGPGEYEIKGVKFSGISKKETMQYFAKLEGIDTVFIQGSAAQKGKEVINECQLAIVDVDVELDQSAIAAFGASVIVLYGTHAQDAAKKIGKETAPTNKYSVTKDKLPGDLEVILLE